MVSISPAAADQLDLSVVAPLYNESQNVGPLVEWILEALAGYSGSFEVILVDDVRTKVRYDLEYIRRRSLGEDIRIMLQTIPVVFLRRGGW